MWQPVEILSSFNNFTLKQAFWKTKKLFRKTEVTLKISSRVEELVESKKIEKTAFRYKTAPSETNVKKNKLGVQKGPITKNKVLSVTNSIFWKFCFSITTSYKELILFITSQMPTFLLFVGIWVLFKGVFSLWVYP